MKTFLIKTAETKAPSHFNAEEAKAWSRGAQYGTAETLAACELWLKAQGQIDLIPAFKEQVLHDMKDRT